MTKNKETLIRTKKARKTQNKTPQPCSDLFTALCRSDLKVRCVKEYRFHPTRRWRFDYAIPEHKIALEVEGGVWTQGRHTRPQGFLGDVAKYNAATVMGWRVLRTVPDELISAKTLRMIQETINNIDNEQQTKAIQTD